MKQLIETFNNLGTSINNNQAIIYRTVKRVAAASVKRSKLEKVSSLEFLAEQTGERNNNNFQLKDVLADVESEVLAKEKVANLAGSDSRKKMVLKAWKDGCTNETEIANLLTDKLGGSFEGHRSFIKRFREKCKQALAGVA